MVYDYDNSRIIYVDSANGEVRAFYPKFPTSQASTSLMIDNVSTMKAIHLTSDGNIILGSTDNNVYYVDDFNGIIDFTDSADKSEYFTDIALMPNDIFDITTDGNDNIYCSDKSNNLYQIKQPYYMITQLQNLPSVSSTAGWSLEPSPDNLLLGYYYLDGTYFEPYITPYEVDTQTSLSYIYRKDNKGPIPTGDTPRIIYLQNGDMLFYYTYYNGAGQNQDLVYLNSSNSYSETLLFRVADSSTSWKGCFNDIVVDENGLIFLGDETGGFIAIDAGGVVESYPYSYSMNTGTGTSLSASFNYITKDINSMYSTYYNNSDIQIEYNIKTDLLEYSSTSNDLSDDFINNYQFRIDLIEPSGINEQSYTILPSQMVRTTHVVTESLLGLPIPTGKAHQYSISGNTIFSNSNNWINGTWTCKLYEVNYNTSVSTLLDTDSFDISNTQSTGTIHIDNIPDKIDGTILTENLVASPYFYALVIICIIGMACGAVAGGAGFLGGATIGVFVSGGMGLIPMWLIISLIIAFIVLFAIIGGKSIGGGN